MADGLEQQLEQPNTHGEVGFEERLALLVDRESCHRKNNKNNRLLKAAKLKLQALPEDIDCRHTRGLQQSQIADLLSRHWIRQHHNVLITQLAKIDLLVLDDWGLEKMTLSQRNDLLEIMKDRHDQRSTLITSQLPITQ